MLFPDNSQLTYRWDSVGRLTNVVDGYGRGLTAAYNNQGLLTTLNAAYGQLKCILYDAANRPVQVTDANGITVTNVFDQIDEILSRSWSGGVSDGFLWAANGLLAYTNYDTNVTWFWRDEAGRLLGLTNANQETTLFTYNAYDQVADVTDGRGNRTAWGYNEYGWLMNKVDGLNNEVLRYTRDAKGQVTNRWTPEFGNTAYSRDAVGNVKTGTHQQSTINCLYDALNRLTNMVDALGVTAFRYTPSGQLSSEDGPWDNDVIGYAYQQGQRTWLGVGSGWNQTNVYDAAWRLTNVISPAGGFTYNYTLGQTMLPGSLVRTLAFSSSAWITNHYDSLARLDYTALVNPWGHALDGYSYLLDPLGLRTNITRDFGLATSLVSIGYDAIGQLTSWTAHESSGAPRANEQLGWSYDTAGNVQYRTNGALLQTFTDDSANQLGGVARSGAFTVSGATPAPAGVTINGQIAQTNADFTFAAGGFTLNDGPNTFTNIARNIYSQSATNTFAVNLPVNVTLLYDSNGNLTNDGTRVFIYDPENRLVTNYVARAWKTEFAYDGLHRRRIVRDYAWLNNQWFKTNETRYVYDGRLIVQERNASNQALVTYTRGRDLSGRLHRAGGIGGLLARTDATGTSAFYHADGSGNITALVDSTGNIAARYLYGPFGSLLGRWGPLADANVMQFSSMPRHQPSGLVLYAFRDYEPTLNRWLTRDPIGLRGGINPYRFVLNSPLRYVDPLGLDAEDADPLPAESEAALRDPEIARLELELELMGPKSDPTVEDAVEQYERDLRGIPEIGPVEEPAEETPEVQAPKLLSLEEQLAQPVESKCVNQNSPPSMLPSPYRLTQPGETYYHYGYGAQAANFANGLRPGGFATSEGDLAGAEAQSGLALPRPTAPPDAVYIVTPPPGTPIRANPVAEPNFGQPGGLPEYQFPVGTPAGSVSGPTPIQQ